MIFNVLVQETHFIKLAHLQYSLYSLLIRKRRRL